MSAVNFSRINDQSSIEIPMDMNAVNKVESLNNRGTNNRLRRNSISRSARNLEAAENDAEHHFLNPNSGNGHRPSFATPEFDDDDELDIEDPSQGNPGVDDGFFTTTETDKDLNNGGGGHHYSGNGPQSPRRRPSFSPSPNPAYGPDLFRPQDVDSTVNGINNNTGNTDFNIYQQRKTLAQGMMDLALLSANANQLRYVLESYNRHPYYYPSIVFISISIVFQIAVGIGLIINSRCNFKDEKQICKANRINNFTVLGIFIVTVVNVFISAFGVADTATNNND